MKYIVDQRSLPLHGPTVSRVPTKRSDNWSLTAEDYVAVLVGVVSFVEFRFVGRLFLTDLLLAATLIFELLKSARRLEQPPVAPLLFLGAAWLASQVLTDILQNSRPEDFLRGWANISLFLINLSALYLLLRSERRLLLCGLGFVAGQTVRVLLVSTPNIEKDPWKFGYAWPVTMVLVLAACVSFERRRKYLALALLAAATFLNFSYNFRSLGFIAFETLTITGCIAYRPDRTAKRRLLYVVAGTIVAGTLFTQAYKFAAANRLLGRAALEKYEIQSAGDMGLLLGGRVEALASLRAIADSPLLGHGSWARDGQYGAALQEELLRHGYVPRRIDTDLIPTHSHILGAWVDAGFLGAVFWFFVLGLAMRAAYVSSVQICSLRVLTIFCALTLAWNIPFSPFGAEERFITPLYVLIVLRAVYRPRVYRRLRIAVAPAVGRLSCSSPVSLHTKCI